MSIVTESVGYSDILLYLQISVSHQKCGLECSFFHNTKRIGSMVDDYYHSPSIKLGYDQPCIDG